jgi:hypothetical protein
MQVILVRQKCFSVFGWLIRIITGSMYSHAAIMTSEGVVYDSSVKKCGVSKQGLLSDAFGKREIMMFYIDCIDDDVDKYIRETIGMKYDYKGVFGWFFNAQDKKSFYCYEWVHNLLVYTSHVEKSRDRTDANDLIKILSNSSYVGPANKWVG